MSLCLCHFPPLPEESHDCGANLMLVRNHLMRALSQTGNKRAHLINNLARGGWLPPTEDYASVPVGDGRSVVYCPQHGAFADQDSCKLCESDAESESTSVREINISEPEE